MRLCVLLAFLRLRERRVVLKYLERLIEKIDGCAAEEKEAPSWCNKVHCIVVVVALVVVVRVLVEDFV